MLILASKSPRRTELLKLAGLEFKIFPAVGEETVPDGLVPSGVVTFLAKQKADEVAKQFPGDVVIGADTVVSLGDTVMGKPKDKNDAYRMLSALSGRIHSVFTGVCIVSEKNSITFFEETKVEFYRLSDEEIYRYIESGEPMDKAGAYGIQEKGALLVKRIDGDFFNVVGLPVSRVVRELRNI